MNDLNALVRLANPNPAIVNQGNLKLDTNYQIVAYRPNQKFKVTIPFYIKVTEIGYEWKTETVGNGSRKLTPAWLLIKYLKKIKDIECVRLMTDINLDKLKATCNDYIKLYKSFGGCWLNDNYYETTATSLGALIPDVTEGERTIFEGLSINAKTIQNAKIDQQERSQRSNNKLSLSEVQTTEDFTLPNSDLHNPIHSIID